MIWGPATVRQSTLDRRAVRVPDILDKIKTSRVKAALKQATCARSDVFKPFNSKRERAAKFFVEEHLRCRARCSHPDT
jgi:hypothetical protein